MLLTPHQPSPPFLMPLRSQHRKSTEFKDKIFNISGRRYHHNFQTTKHSLRVGWVFFHGVLWTTHEVKPLLPRQ